MNEHASTPNPNAATEPVVIEREVRFAVVMYGGVSLAIYINGVAQELLRLVRATATVPLSTPAAAIEQQGGEAVRLLIPEDKLEPTEKVYRKIARMLDENGGWEPDPSARQERAPVRTRFVIDIVSGTSAGGLNGIFLAKALAQGEELKSLAKLWVEEGAIEKLINDDDSNDFDNWHDTEPPASLLNSRRMYRKLFDVFCTMDAERKCALKEGSSSAGVPLAQDIDLFVTTTDIRGLPVALRLADGVVPEMRHRNSFHFRFRAPSALATEAEGGRPSASDLSEAAGVNDFVEQNNPFLAFASRCTSSFPGAFEPMTLNDIDQVVPLVGLREPPRPIAGDASPWYKFFPAYVGAADGDAASDDSSAKAEAARSASPWATGSERDLATRAFGDGGYLDNKPFGYAIDAVSGRRAPLPVDRKLLYVEPSPEHPELVANTIQRPTVVENVNAALSLARDETIRGDLERVLERNRVIERLQRILTGIDADIAIVDPMLDETAQKRREEFETGGLRQMLERFGAAYGGYHRLKVSALTDELTDYVVRAGGYNDESDEVQAIRHMVAAWRGMRFEPFADPKSGKETENVLLMRYDLSYRIRRLDFALARIDILLPANKGAAGLLSNAGLHADFADQKFVDAFRAALKTLRHQLGPELDRLRQQRGRLLSRRTKDHPLRAAVQAFRLDKHAIEMLLKGASVEERVEAARQLIEQRQLEPAFRELEKTLQALIAPVSIAAADACKGWLPPPPIAKPRDGAELARAIIRRSYWAYDRYDQLIFPAIFATDVGQELDVIDVVRISPEDAPSLIDQRKSDEPRHKLAGDAFGHFGAFLDRRWRWNDIMWGRLDGAERLITTLLPGETPLHIERRRELLREAQLAILSEEFRKPEAEQMAWAPIDVRNGFADLIRLTRTDSGYTAAWSHFCDRFGDCYACPRELDAGPALEVAARATRVVGGMLDRLADDYAVLRKPATWLARAGAIAWGLVEAATPQSLLHFSARYWIKLLFLFEVVLIVVGGMLGNSALGSFGVTALAYTVAARLALLLLSGVIAPRRSGFGLIAALAALVTSVPIILGTAALFDDKMRGRVLELLGDEAGRGNLLRATFIAAGTALFTAGALVIEKKSRTAKKNRIAKKNPPCP